MSVLYLFHPLKYDCVLCVYFACILRVLCCLLSTIGIVSMCFPRVWRRIGAVHTVWSPNKTKHAKYTQTL